MLIVKAIQIRDEGTNIPAITWRFRQQMNGRERAIVRRAGFHDTTFVMLTRLVDMESQYDPHKWAGGARTMKIAHLLLQGQLTVAACKNLEIVPEAVGLYAFSAIQSGDVLDVGHALGINARKEFE